MGDVWASTGVPLEEHIATLTFFDSYSAGSLRIQSRVLSGDRLEKTNGGRAVAPDVTGSLSARLLEVQEAERRRLARELHDDLGQRVTALRMELSRLEAGPGAENAGRLSRARDLAGEILEAIRDVSSMLRPTILDDLGLKAALDWHVRKFYQRTGIPCTLICSLKEPDDLPDLVRICIYRVIQEALNNCEKHASATSVHVTVERGDLLNMAGDVSVTVADNGSGIQSGIVSHEGSGISGMRERVETLGGTFTIESSEGEGTAVMLTIPVHYAPGGTGASQ